MRFAWLLMLGACSFSAPTGEGVVQSDAEEPSDSAVVDAAIDAAIPDADLTPHCGDGVVQAGEMCEPGIATTCVATSCGDLGTATCAPDCMSVTACTMSIDPTTAWDIGETPGGAFAPAPLPFLDIPCDNCTRLFRTEVCDKPKAVVLQYSSDNAARLRVNGMTAFDQYFLANYCTDEVCCNKCCDSPAHCLERVTDPIKLAPAALARFHAGVNTLLWELSEEGGGAGFYTTMTLTY